MTMEHGPNIRSQDVRYRRTGGDVPYRDDPVSFVVKRYEKMMLKPQKSSLMCVAMVGIVSLSDVSGGSRMPQFI